MIPISYFWIIEYSNGTALPQFDPETGKENKVNLENAVKISWNPITPQVKIADEHIVKDYDLFGKRVVVDIKEGEGPILYRENHRKFSPTLDDQTHIVKYVIGKKKGDVEFKVVIEKEEIRIW